MVCGFEIGGIMSNGVLSPGISQDKNPENKNPENKKTASLKVEESEVQHRSRVSKEDKKSKDLSKLSPKEKWLEIREGKLILCMKHKKNSRGVYRSFLLNLKKVEKSNKGFTASIKKKKSFKGLEIRDY